MSIGTGFDTGEPRTIHKIDLHSNKWKVKSHD